MKRFPALVSLCFTFIILLIFFPKSAFAAITVEADPNSPKGILEQTPVQMTAFGCSAGAKVRFFWRTDKNSNKYETSPLKDVIKDSATGALIAVHIRNEGFYPDTYFIHANCSNPSQDSLEIPLIVKETSSGQAIDKEAVTAIPDTLEGYKPLAITYANFQPGQCYGIRLASKDGFETGGKGSYLPNYSECSFQLAGTYFQSDTLPASGTITIDGLRPGNYTIFVEKAIGAQNVTGLPDSVFYRKDLRVTDSKNNPKVRIDPDILKPGDPAKIYAEGCPANSTAQIYWSKKDHQLKEQKTHRDFPVDSNGKLTLGGDIQAGENDTRYFVQTFNNENNNELWVECGAGLSSPYAFFTVTNKDRSKFPKIHMNEPKKTEPTTNPIVFPKGVAIEIQAEGCPNVGGTANFQWKHAKQSAGWFEQWGSRDNVKIDDKGVTEKFAVTFAEDNDNQIQVYCSDAQSLPYYFTIGDPSHVNTNENPTEAPPIPTAKPIYAPCLQGKNAAGQTIDIIKPGEKPTQEVIDGRLQDLVECTMVDTAIGGINTNPGDFIVKLFQIILSLSGGVALLIVIMAGYRYMTSQGNAESIKAAQEQVTSAVVGLLFLLFSMVILQVIGVDILHLPGFDPNGTTPVTNTAKP